MFDPSKFKYYDDIANVYRKSEASYPSILLPGNKTLPSHYILDVCHRLHVSPWCFANVLNGYRSDFAMVRDLTEAGTITTNSAINTFGNLVDYNSSSSHLHMQIFGTEYDPQEILYHVSPHVYQIERGVLHNALTQYAGKSRTEAVCIWDEYTTQSGAYDNPYIVSSMREILILLYELDTGGKDGISYERTSDFSVSYGTKSNRDEVKRYLVRCLGEILSPFDVTVSQV